MKTLLLTISVVLLLQGCSSVPQSTPVPKVVKIAVPISCPVPAKVPNKDLPINHLTAKDANNFSKISQAYVLSIQMLKSENQELRAALIPYEQKPIK